MSSGDDPYFVVRSEVVKALNKTRSLYLRQTQELNEGKTSQDFTTTELRNALRSVLWDIEDLEDTISIVEKNPQKFKLDARELDARRQFVNATRKEIQELQTRLNYNRAEDITHQPLLSDSPKVAIANHGGGIHMISSAMAAAKHSGAKYSKLENAPDSPSHYDASANRFLNDQIAIQGRMMNMQDEQLDVISDTVGQLKTVSRQIGSELDEQAVMLDEFGSDFDAVESRLDSNMKRVAKVLHLNNDRNQWTAIIILSILLVIIVVLFVVL